MSHPLRLVVRVLVAALIALALTMPTRMAFAQDDAPDVVHLKNGGRLRGVVVEESPTTGVRIKLPTGTIKTVPAAEVDKVEYGGQQTPSTPPVAPPVTPPVTPPAVPPTAPPGLPPIAASPSQPGTPATPETPAPTGRIHIVLDDDDQAEVWIRKPIGYRRHGEFQPVGHVSHDKPLDLDLPEGKYRVRLDFDVGATAETTWVQPGSQSDIVFYSTKRFLKRPKFLVGLGGPSFGVLTVVPSTGFGNATAFAAGPSVELGAAIPITPTIDLIPSAVLVFYFADTTAVRFTARGKARFGIGSVYGIEAGVEAGVLSLLGGTNPARFLVGPTWSLLSLRLGARRNVVVGFDQSFAVALPPNQNVIINPNNTRTTQTQVLLNYNQDVQLKLLF